MKTMIWLVDRILSRYNVHVIILFGYRARRDWLPSSDYDILVVADLDKSFLDRSYELTELIEGDWLSSGIPSIYARGGKGYALERVSLYRGCIRGGSYSVRV